MNVFYLDQDPELCAKMHNDKHVVKMCTEYAQLMSTAHRVTDGELWYGRTSNGRRIARYFLPNGEMNEVLYKASHINHPSNQWVRSSEDHYNWLYAMWMNLCQEYTHRYGRVHEAQRKLELYLMMPPVKIDNIGFNEPPPAMKEFPQCIVKGDSIKSYHNYYWEAKRSFCHWTNRETPEWYQEYERNASVG